jgi:hypothetical protein
VDADDLIFGCSTIADHATLAVSLRLLDQASEVGIRHFDTARAYGAGSSEDILGRHLRGRREATIVTTKHGLVPPISSELVSRAYSRARLGQRTSPALNGLRRVRNALRPSLFSPAKIRTNLELSLRALGTDYVDYFLLHEASTGEAQRRAVQQTLDELVAEGKVRDYGIGSAYAKIGPDEGLIPAGYRVLQFEHSPLARTSVDPAKRAGRLIFTHSALSDIGRVVDLLDRHPELVREHGARLDVDVASPEVLPGLLLAYSHTLNPGGKVIFSTRSPRRIVTNVQRFRETCAWSSDRVLDLQRFFDELADQSGSG